MEIEIDSIAGPNMKTVLGYWNSLRGDRFASTWEEFDFLALGPHFIPYLTVVDVHREPLDFVFRFWGTAHQTSKG